MATYITADLHLNDPEIIALCARPHKSPEHGLKRLVADANMRAKKGDTLIHVGDFAHKEAGKHPRDLIGLFDARLIFVEGNHDGNNGVSCDCDYMVINCGGLKALVTHYPTFNPKNEVIYGAKWDFLRDNAHHLADFAICGHVHTAWNWKVDEHNGLINVNVGVDVNKYRPLTLPEVANIARRAAKTLGR